MKNPDTSCREITFDGANNAERCKCKGATLNAYHGMISSGAADSEALEAAYKVYRYHHPTDSVEDSHLTVERWIYTASAH